jgi:O-antigen/teichoic acid export membrane protein
LAGLVVGMVVVFLRLGASMRKPTFEAAMLRRLVSFSVPLIPATLAYWAITSGNRLIVSYYLGHEPLGLFAALGAIPAMIVMSYTVLSSIFLAGLSRVFERGAYRDVDTWMQTVFRLYAVLSVALASAGFVCCETIVTWVAGSAYFFRGAEWVFLLIGLGSVAFGLLQVSTRLYDLERMPWRSSSMWVTVAALTVAVNLQLVPRFGLIGCAIANLAALSGGHVMVRLQKFPSLAPRFPHLLTIAFAGASVAFAVAVRGLGIPCGIVQLLLGTTVFLVVAAVGWAMRVFDRESLSRVLR